VSFWGAVVAGVVILADSAGYLWGGIFSSFPGTITPVLVLLHLKEREGNELQHNKKFTNRIKRHWALFRMVWLLYPLYGIYCWNAGIISCSD